MVTKEELLRDIAKSKNISKEEFVNWATDKGLDLKPTRSWEGIIAEVIPKRAISKADLEAFMAECVEEEIEEEIQIKRKTKRKTTRAATVKGTKILVQLPPREKILHECNKCKSLDLRTIQTIAEIYKTICKCKSKYDRLDSFNGETLGHMYRAFVNKEHDSSGKYLELRAIGYYLTQAFKEFDKEARGKLTRIELHKNLTTEAGSQENFDIVAYYEDYKTIDVMECKDRKTPIDETELNGYLEDIRQVDALKKTFWDVADFYLVTSSDFRPRALATVRHKAGESGEWNWETAMFKLITTNSINIHLMAERDGELKQVYP